MKPGTEWNHLFRLHAHCSFVSSVLNVTVNHGKPHITNHACTNLCIVYNYGT